MASGLYWGGIFHGWPPVAGSGRGGDFTSQWRIYGLIAAAVASLLAGVFIFIALSRHLGQKPLAFDQSLAELKKDMTCFSRGNEKDPGNQEPPDNML